VKIYKNPEMMANRIPTKMYRRKRSSNVRKLKSKKIEKALSPLEKHPLLEADDAEEVVNHLSKSSKSSTVHAAIIQFPTKLWNRANAALSKPSSLASLGFFACFGSCSESLQQSYTYCSNQDDGDSISWSATVPEIDERDLLSSKVDEWNATITSLNALGHSWSTTDATRAPATEVTFAPGGRTLISPVDGDHILVQPPPYKKRIGLRQRSRPLPWKKTRTRPLW
jgi:hypothetical protein